MFRIAIALVIFSTGIFATGVCRRSTYRLLDDQVSAELVGGQIHEGVPFGAEWHGFTWCDQIPECFSATCDDFGSNDCDSNIAREAVATDNTLGCNAASFNTSCYQWSGDGPIVSLDNPTCAEFHGVCVWGYNEMEGVWGCVNTGGTGLNPSAPQHCRAFLYF